jgi:hypothetical protein
MENLHTVFYAFIDLISFDPLPKKRSLCSVSLRRCQGKTEKFLSVEDYRYNECSSSYAKLLVRITCRFQESR